MIELRPWWRLTRFEHALLYSIAVLLGELFSFCPLPNFPILICSLLIPIFAEMGAFALNDFVDIETDIINKKNRPIVKGEIKLRHAFKASVLFLCFSIALSFLISKVIAIFTLVLVCLAIAYNFLLKRLPFIGNVYIAFTMASPFLFGNLVVCSKLSYLNISLALTAFLVGLAREIIKDIEDVKGDEKVGMKTLPLLVGKKPSAILAIAFYLFALYPSYLIYSSISALHPHVLSIFLILFGYAIGLIGPIILMLYWMLKDKEEILKRTRIISLFGIACVLLGLALLFLGPWSNLV